MPAYISNAQAQQIVALYPGSRLNLVNNAATDTGVTNSWQFVCAPNPLGGTRITFINTTNQSGTIQLADQDIAANYQPASGGSVGSGSSLVYNVSQGWCRINFASAPTTGSFIVAA